MWTKINIKEIETKNELIGYGSQGKVYKLSPDRCIKIYLKEKHAKMEAKVLRSATSSRFFPKIYETGPNYNVMEYIKGRTLNNYLEKEGKLSNEIIKEIVMMLKEMERLNFTRVDARLRHIFITNENKIKVIDHVNSFKISSNYPKHLFRGLKKLGHLQFFLEEANKFESELCMRWRKVNS
ncbi:hypothetical protein LIT38_00895 [Bacillus sp. CMF12]|uniref:AarF/UbiB family protein n=1 Tax=Bacillaceae TaxID=186817 RepID=UPI001FB45788|nr:MULTISPECIES: AarF/UbiB family protein [Bacillaceae]UOE55656.1 hypothetical protein IRB79_02125 [Cytobacillus oceanisediminis]USK50113.1 hypothetical protein LIT38_00895 [Bacillus sp. CMF12]